MTGLERLSQLGKELWFILEPTDLTSWISLIAIAVIFIVALLSGSFFKTFFSLMGVMVLLFILNSISPVLMWGLIAGAILWYLLNSKTKIPWKHILWVVVVVGATLMAIYNFFA